MRCDWAAPCGYAHKDPTLSPYANLFGRKIYQYLVFNVKHNNNANKFCDFDHFFCIELSGSTTREVSMHAMFLEF